MRPADRLAAAAPGDPPVPVHDPDDARRTIEEVLAGPGFGDDRTWFERARDWVFDQLGELFETVLTEGGGSILGWILLAALSVLVVWLAVRATGGVHRDPSAVVAEGRPARRPAAEWRAEAEAHEARGAWRAALRCRYRALIADLAHRGLVDEVPGRTAGEYRREVVDRVPAAADAFGGATALFEAAWYGNRATGPDESERFRALADRVVDGTGGR